MDTDVISQRVIELHEQLREHFGQVTRIAVAIYDAENDTLSTFANRTDGGSPLTRYRVCLAEVPSLKALADSGDYRVIHDLSELEHSSSRHSRVILEAGYRSSLTLPLFHHGELLGFLFFDAPEPNYFQPGLVQFLLLYGQLLGAAIAAEMLPLRTLVGAVVTASEFSRFRHEETGAHLLRVALYSRQIAECLPESFGLSDEYIRFLEQFAPLHDVGKVAIPDSVLLKPGELTEDERAIMRGHVASGLSIVDTMIKQFGVGHIEHIEILRELVAGHHENWDGSGYPAGLSGDAIPLPARILATADRFDALTSARVYKAAWPVDRAVTWMRAQAGRQFDPACVSALIKCLPAIRRIAEQHGEPRHVA